MQQLKRKLYENAIKTEQLNKLDKKEKRTIILSLIRNKTEQELSNELGIPKSTIHDWKTLRQSGKGKDVHVSLSAIIRKLKGYKPSTAEEYAQLTEIQIIVGTLLDKGTKENDTIQ